MLFSIEKGRKFLELEFWGPVVCKLLVLRVWALYQLWQIKWKIKNLREEQDTSVPDKCGANTIGKIQYFLLWYMADIELTAFNEGQGSQT